MIKYPFFALVVLLVSCGRTDVGEGRADRIGFFRPLTTTALTSTDRTNINNVCAALARKETYLPQSLNVPLYFQTTQTDCEGNTIGNGLTEVVIQSDLGGYAFKRKSDGQPFIFPQVETTASGVLAAACAAAGRTDSVNPIPTENGSIFVSTTDILNNDCAPALGEQCVLLETANIQNGQYFIHSREWLRVRTEITEGKTGFVTFRKKVAKAFCDENQSIVQQAILK